MRRTAATLALVLAGLLAAPAVAPARALLGMGDQKPTMFSDARFKWLGVKRARIVVSWDVQRSKREREWANTWLADAQRAGVEPLVAFGHAWSGKKRKHLPSVGEYRAAIRRFRRAHPRVRVYTAWNEANHCSQPTCHRPERAAAYFDVLRSECPRCTVVAADVLDQGNMAGWLRRFRRAVRHEPRIWGLHNYLDANRLRSKGTRHFLRLVKGRVWITETGGIVRRNGYKGQIRFPESPEHAGKVTSFILRLADRTPRIDRVYLYQWNADSLFQTWDSGIIGPFGDRRPSYAVLARHRGRNPSKAPADPPFAPQGTGPAPPGPAGPGAEQAPPPSSSPPPQSPPPSQPAPACTIPIICPVVSGG